MLYAVCVWPKSGGMMIGWASGDLPKVAADKVAQELQMNRDKKRWPAGEYTFYVHPVPPDEVVRASTILTYSLDKPVEQFTLQLD